MNNYVFFAGLVLLVYGIIAHWFNYQERKQIEEEIAHLQQIQTMMLNEVQGIDKHLLLDTAWLKVTKQAEGEFDVTDGEGNGKIMIVILRN